MLQPGVPCSLPPMLPSAVRPRTIAVVGTGVDRIYPRGHQALAHQIVQQGFIVSEYPLGTPPLAASFPKRSRLIAGACRPARWWWRRPWHRDR